jgi:hypothetical protein
MLCVAVILFGDDLIGDQVNAACGGEPVIVLDSGNISPIHFLTARRSWVSCVGVVVFVAGFIKMVLQLLLRFASALPDGPGLLRAWQRFVPRSFVSIVHNGILSRSSGRAFNDVGDDDTGFRSQDSQQALHGLGSAGFLKHDDVEAGDHFGKAGDHMQVPLWEFFGPAIHLAVRSPQNQMFHVAIRRLDDV